MIYKWTKKLLKKNTQKTEKGVQGEGKVFD